MATLEFWPDYDGDLLWTETGTAIGLDRLPLPDELRAEATRWLDGYDDAKLPWEPTSDATWLAEGRRLFRSLREALAPLGYDLIADEGHWESVGD